MTLPNGMVKLDLISLRYRECDDGYVYCFAVFDESIEGQVEVGRMLRRMLDNDRELWEAWRKIMGEHLTRTVRRSAKEIGVDLPIAGVLEEPSSEPRA